MSVAEDILIRAVTDYSERINKPFNKVFNIEIGDAVVVHTDAGLFIVEAITDEDELRASGLPIDALILMVTHRPPASHN